MTSKPAVGPGLLERLTSGKVSIENKTSYVQNVTEVVKFNDFKVSSIAVCKEYLAIGGRNGLIEMWSHEPT